MKTVSLVVIKRQYVPTKRHANTDTLAQTWYNSTTLTMMKCWQLFVQFSTSLYRWLTAVITNVRIRAITRITTVVATISDSCNVQPCIIRLPGSMPANYWTSPSMWPVIQGAVLSHWIFEAKATSGCIITPQSAGRIPVMLKDIWR